MRYPIILLCSTLLLISFSSCENSTAGGVIPLEPDGFDTIVNGSHVQLYTLRNKSGCMAQFTNYGGRWVSMWVPDRKGNMTDVVLGFNKVEKYMKAGEPYHGAIVGRICGRINNAAFVLNGNTYTLAENDGFGMPMKNHLHGGFEGFHSKVWRASLFRDKNGEESITFTYLSPDGEEGFPGELEVEVSYLLTDDNEIRIEYRAVTNAATIVNLTNHAFFNLNGEGCGNILNHQMRVHAEKYIECDRELIPTGELKPVENTPLDYRKYASMGKGIDLEHNQIFKGLGYAAAMVLKEENNSRQQLLAEAYGDRSGIRMEVFSDQASLQLYNAWLFTGDDVGKSGKPYEFSGGFVMETQAYPDAPNHKHFPSIEVLPGDEYKHTSIYRFSLAE